MKPEIPNSIRSTDEFAKGTFRPHGRLEVRIDGAILRADGYGPFNSEFIRALARTFQDLRSSALVPRPYADLIQFHGSLMASQDMLTELSQMLERVDSVDIACALAFVVEPNVEGRDFMLPLFERVLVSHGRNFRSFDNLPEAEAWVRECLEAASRAV